MRLHVPLKLQGSDTQGQKFEELVTTEDVSLSGFLFACATRLPADSVVRVSLMSNGKTDYVGKAKIVHSSTKETLVRQYGCRFTEKVGPWVLQ